MEGRQGNIIKLLSNKEVFLNFFICIVWGNMLLGYLRGIVNHLPLVGNHTDVIILLTILIPLILALPALLNKFCVFDYIFFSLMVTAYLLNYALHPENTEYLNKHIFECLCIATPIYFIGRVFDIDKYFTVMTLISTICVLTSLFYFLHYAQSAKKMSDVAGDDNMYTAYMALPHVILLLWNSLKRFNILHIAATLAGMLFLLSCGTRGPLACIGFFGVCYFMFFFDFRYSFLIKTMLTCLLGIILLFARDIISYLAFIFTGFKLSTRVLDKLISGEIGNDSGRSTLRKALTYYLDTYGNWGGLGYFGSQRFGYVYAHNLILDFFISYGYVAGGILLFLLFTICTLAYVRCKTKGQRCFILLLVSITIIKFFLSSTFLCDMFFYFLIGYCCRININHKNNS